jgi:hypothetical protein
MDLSHDMDTNFAAVRALLLKARGLPGPADRAPILEHMLLEFQGIYVYYTTATAPARLRLLDPRSRDAALGDLKMAITGRDFPGELRALLGRLRRMLAPDQAVPGKGSDKRIGRKKLSASPNPILEHLDLLYRRVGGVASLNEAQASREAAEAAAKAVEFVDCDTCEDCTATLILESGGAEGRCPECQRVYELHGVVYEDTQVFSQEGQRNKSGQFNPNRHFIKWLNRILALGPETEIGDSADADNLTGEKLISRLTFETHRMNFFLSHLDVARVRQLLKTVGRTDLNQNAALILKKLNGLEPPALSEKKRVRGEMMFSQVIQVLSNSYATAGNRNYYPYYIYKIYDLVLDDDDSDRFMLWFIHLQGADTLSNNDREWKHICATLHWEWRPTDPGRAGRYRTLYGKVRV